MPRSRCRRTICISVPFDRSSLVLCACTPLPTSLPSDGASAEVLTQIHGMRQSAIPRGSASRTAEAGQAAPADIPTMPDCPQVYLQHAAAVRQCAGRDAALRTAQHSSSSSSVVAAASRQRTDSSAQPSSARRLSRTGKPVAWSVLPPDDEDDDDASSSRRDADAAASGRNALPDEVRILALSAHDFLAEQGPQPAEVSSVRVYSAGLRWCTFAILLAPATSAQGCYVRDAGKQSFRNKLSCQIKMTSTKFPKMRPYNSNWVRPKVAGSGRRRSSCRWTS